MNTSPFPPELRRALAGDDAALGQLIRAHQGPLLRFGKRVCADAADAEDAVQEAFVTLARRMDLPRAQPSTLAWLFSVVRNRCLRFLRRAQLLRQRLLRRAAEPQAPGATPEQLLARYRLGELVRAALAELEPIHRQVLVLRDIEGLSGEQVCAALQLSEPAMKSRLHRARATLRQTLLRSVGETEGSW